MKDLASFSKKIFCAKTRRDALDDDETAQHKINIFAVTQKRFTLQIRRAKGADKAPKDIT